MFRVRVLAWLSRVGRDPDRELREFKEEFYRASREKDRDALERILHPEFSMVTIDGHMMSKRAMIAGVVASESDLASRFQRQERSTTFNASRDMAREVADVRIGGYIPGQGDITGEYTQTGVFIRGTEGWQFLGDTLTKKNPREQRATAGQAAGGQGKNEP
jgi:hypothetical protein